MVEYIQVRQDIHPFSQDQEIKKLNEYRKVTELSEIRNKSIYC